MSSRDKAAEAMEARYSADPESSWLNVLDAAHAAGLIIYADELEQVGWLEEHSPMGVAGPEFTSCDGMQLDADELDGLDDEPVYRRKEKSDE